MAPLLGGELIGKRYKKIHSLKTNIAPEKRRSEKSEKETSIPTIHFQVLCYQVGIGTNFSISFQVVVIFCE